MATHTSIDCRDQFSLSYTLQSEQASYWLGFVRSFVTGLWAMVELILLPVLLLAISRRLNFQGIGLFSLTFFCIISMPLALTSHLFMRAYLQSYLPRIVGLDLASGTLFLECPRQSDSWPLVKCSWARGVTLQDMVGELLPNQAAILIQLPHDEPQLPPQVIAIPDVVDDEAWQNALISSDVPLFNPESVTRYLKTPGLLVRSMGRGISLGILIAFGLSALIEWIAGQPFWVPGVYMLSVIAGVWASGYYSVFSRDEANGLPSKLSTSLSCSTLFALTGIATAAHEQLDPLAFTGAILVHIVGGLALTWLLILIVQQLFVWRSAQSSRQVSGQPH